MLITFQFKGAEGLRRSLWGLWSLLITSALLYGQKILIIAYENGWKPTRDIGSTRNWPKYREC